MSDGSSAETPEEVRFGAEPGTSTVPADEIAVLREEVRLLRAALHAQDARLAGGAEVARGRLTV